MGLMDKIKKAKKKNVFGDKRAQQEGAGGPPKNEREKRQRENFKKLHGIKD